MKRLVFALCLVLTAATTNACGHTAPAAAPDGRTLAKVEPLITRDLTPALALARLGAPDEQTGSGLIILKYRVDAGRTVWLSFPGFAPIIAASVEDQNGTRRALILR